MLIGWLVIQLANYRETTYLPVVNHLNIWRADGALFAWSFGRASEAFFRRGRVPITSFMQFCAVYLVRDQETRDVGLNAGFVPCAANQTVAIDGACGGFTFGATRVEPDCRHLDQLVD